MTGDDPTCDAPWQVAVTCEVDGCRNQLGGPRDGLRFCSVCLTEIEALDREQRREREYDDG